MKPHGDAWLHVEGSDAARVVVYEDVARGGRVTMRWWDPNKKPKGNWRRKSLGKVLDRDRRGRPLPESIAWAKQEARRKSVALGDGITEGVAAQARPFTISETESAITHAETGKYPHKTAMREELVRALRFAVQVWGGDTPWKAIDDGEWVKLIRRRIETLVKREKVGIRTAEITVSRLSTAARWLRRRKTIPADAGIPPDDWKQEGLRHWRSLTKATRDPQPSRPRHTLDEMRKIIAAAPKVDPRLALLLEMGAEYRLGQVIRARRSDVDLERGSLTVHGQGKKGGETIMLTAGQLTTVRAALGGFLRELEAAWVTSTTDYWLFPAGKLLGRKASEWRMGPGIDITRHASREWVAKNFHQAETAASVDYVKGRGPYGLRRQGVDAAKAAGIGPDGLKAAGGWSSTKIPNEIYAEETNQRGREEARDVRAKTRGETK